MEQSKKRRNSILKKCVTNEDETTGDVTTKLKRRISFSGKKSVKEFIAGEEEATIWGTSYEESADGLHASSMDSGLVNVNEKRMVLRNRRVVFESNPKTKRRSKKKVNVAENDKENICAEPSAVQAPVDIPQNQTETPKPPNIPVIEVEDETPSETANKPKSERLNVCSNTLDYINFSATTNKSISIEQSVDVTLSESELQMFKFRNPVSTAESSPNLGGRDSLSPNIFSRSILMSEEDVNMLKMIREKQKTEAQATENQVSLYGLNKDVTRNRTVTNTVNMETEFVQETAKKRETVHGSLPMAIVQPADNQQNAIVPVDMDTTIADDECVPKSCDADVMDVASTQPAVDGKKRITMHMNETMDASRYDKPETNRLKRKTITRTMTMDMTTSNLADNNSPLRKRLMPNVDSNLMEITNYDAESALQEDEAKSRTIHFKPDAVEDGELDLSLDGASPSRNTIYFDHNQISEDSICHIVKFKDKSGPDATSTCMEMSLRDAETLLQPDGTKRRTIHFEYDAVEESITCNSAQDVLERPAASRKTIYFDHNQIREDSICQEKSNRSCNLMVENKANAGSVPQTDETKRRTIYFESAGVEESPIFCSVQEDRELPTFSRKTINFDHTEIREDSICQSKSILNAPDSGSEIEITKQPTMESHQTQVDLEISLDMPSSPHYQNRGASQTKEFAADNNLSMELTVCEPKDSEQQEVPHGSKSSIFQRTIQGENHVEIPLVSNEQGTTNVRRKQRESVYTPSDIDLESPKATKPLERSNHTVKPAFHPFKERRSVYTATEMIEDSPKASVIQPSKKRESVYIASDMIEDSPKPTRSSTAPTQVPSDTMGMMKNRQSIYTATDIVEESPIQPQKLKGEIEKPIPKVIVKHMNVQQGILGAALTFKAIKCQKTSSQEEQVIPEPVLKTSSIPDQTETISKPNFHTLNEDLLHGRAKAFAEHRRARPSLFDRSENNPTEDMSFSFFMNKSMKKDIPVAPVRTTMTDYTMELSTRNANNRYPVGLSFGESIAGCKEMDVTQDLQQKSIAEGCRELLSKRKTIHFHENDELDVSTAHSERQAMHIDQEVNADESKCIAQEDSMDLSLAPAPASKHRSKRQTIHSNDDIQEEPLTTESKKNSGGSVSPVENGGEINISHQIIDHESHSSTGHSKRYTIHTRHPMDLDERTSDATSIAAKSSNRNTIHFNQDVDVERTAYGNIASQQSRQTIHFQDDKVDAIPIPDLQDDSAMNLSIAHEPEAHTKPLPKPRRLTILDDHPVDLEVSPEKCTARKSSFIRNLNFDQIPANMKPTVNDNSPLYFPNKRTRSPQTTTEINHSLAEYLKIEAAARSCHNSPLDMSVEEIPKRNTIKVVEDNVEKQVSKRQTSYEPVNVFEESGMLPLDQLPLRRQMPATPQHIVAGQEQDNSMEVSLVPEPTDQTGDANKANHYRKTIHFANEDAVDESFFDEMVPKANNIQRKTILFDALRNPVSDMDITLAANKTKSMCRSKAAQSMKDVLLESNFLFTQAEQLKAYSPTIERSIVSPSSTAENAMEVATANADVDCVVESMPTKNKLRKSRIPQLIDSPKKLQSIKKSMDYIQQELPNLIGSLHKETLNNMSTDSPSVEVEKHQESFETVEIPRKISTNPRQLLKSLDGVARRATTFQRNETLNPCLDEGEIADTSPKSLFKFDSGPITISDVSTFFTQKPLVQGVTDPQPRNEMYSPNTPEALCNLDLNRLPDAENNLPKSSDSEDTVHNFDKFKQRYLELTCDTIMLSGLKEDIEKTHLSLVNTLDEASDVVLPLDCTRLDAVEPPSPLRANETPRKTDAIDTSPQPDAIETQPQASLSVQSLQQPLKPIASVCRKCKRNPANMSQNDTTIGSFMLEPLPEYKMNLDALRELRSRPKILDVAKVWRQKLRESDSFVISNENQSIALDANDSVEVFTAALDKERLRMSHKRQRKEVKNEITFVNKVLSQMQSKRSRWLLNQMLLAGNILKFSHPIIRTFAILIRFTPNDPQAIDVTFDEIKLISNSLHTRHWTAFEYALHYQLFVELPFDLRKLCPTSENLFQFLDHVEEVAKDVLKTGNDMLNLVLSSPATIIREPSGNLYIRKIARRKTPENDVKLTEFQIEVRNMKKLSYESILVPPLYEFDEKIQLLPIGQDFLRIFLADPIKYMKS